MSLKSLVYLLKVANARARKFINSNIWTIIALWGQLWLESNRIFLLKLFSEFCCFYFMSEKKCLNVLSQINNKKLSNKFRIILLKTASYYYILLVWFLLTLVSILKIIIRHSNCPTFLFLSLSTVCYWTKMYNL